MDMGNVETFAGALKRARIQAGFSVNGLAQRIGYSRSHLSNIELGHRRCPGELVPVLDSVLNADGDLTRAWEAAEEMRRRDLLCVAPAAVGFALPSNDAGHRLSRLRLRLLVRHEEVESATPLIPVALEDGIARAHSLYQKASYSAVAEMLPPLIADAERNVIWSSDSDGSHRLLGAANLAASKLAAKLGDAELAWIMADRALTSTRQAGDVALRAVASAQAAISLARNANHLAVAEALAHTAYDQAMAGTAEDARIVSARGNLLLVNATIAARMKQRAGAANYLALARKVAGKLGRDRNQLWTAFGPTNVELHKVAIAVSFDQPDKALSAAERIDTASMPESLVGRRAQLHLDLAAAHNQTRDGVASAVLHLLEAERIAPQIVRINHHARRLLLALMDGRRRRTTPGLEALAQRAGVAS